MTATAEKLTISRKVELSPGHRVMPHRIIRAPDGDLIVIGSTDGQMDDRAWATRLSPTGEVRWDFLEGGPDGWTDHSKSGQRLNGAIAIPDGTTLLCGTKQIDRRFTVFLIKLDRQGALLTEKLMPQIRENAVNSLRGCFSQGEHFFLIGTSSGVPRGTGWISKLDSDFNVETTAFGDYGSDDFLQVNGSLYTISWDGKYILKLTPSGEMLAKNKLPNGSPRLVHGVFSPSTIQVVTQPEFKSTVVVDFDDQLRGPKRELSLYNVGLKAALKLPDGTTAIFGSQFTDSATAAVTRIRKDGQYASLRLEPLHESPWYIDAVLTGNGNEVAAVRQVGLEQGMLDFISFK